MPKVLAFDLDGTLAPSKSSITIEMSERLAKLLESYQVCVISGGTFGQFEAQLTDRLPRNAMLKNLHLMPTCGTQYYRFNQGGWHRIYAENFTEKEKGAIITALNDSIDALGLREPVTYGPVIEDRGSQITFSALGQNIVDELGDEGIRLKEAWDPKSAKKTALRDRVAKVVPMFDVHIGGETSIDITRQGVDKAYGIKKLLEILSIQKSDVIFFGDRLEQGGNDYPVQAMGLESIAVSGWNDTLRKLKKY